MDRFASPLVLLFLVTIAPPVFAQSSGGCETLRVRQDVRNLSPEQWQDFVRTFRQMYRAGTFEQFARIHHTHFRTIHDNPQFLFWHRYFVWDFENAMRSFNPNLTLPYWDGAADFSAPHTSIVFRPDYFGGNGDRRRRYCIKNGFQANLIVNYPNRHCLRRDFQGDRRDTIAPWHSPALITSLIQTTSGRGYDNFRQQLEYSLHNSIHFSVGGSNGDFSQSVSPLDALFYLHHANIDRIFTKWQHSHRSNTNSVNGRQLQSDGGVRAFNRNSNLDYYGARIRSIIRTDSAPLCYTYDEHISSRKGFTETIKKRLLKLPKEFLVKYFPQILQGPEFEHDFSDLRSFDRSVSAPVPQPRDVPSWFLEAMGLNSTVSKQIGQRINQFIRDLNVQRPIFRFKRPPVQVDEFEDETEEYEEFD